MPPPPPHHHHPIPPHPTPPLGSTPRRPIVRRAWAVARPPTPRQQCRDVACSAHAVAAHVQCRRNACSAGAMHAQRMCNACAMRVAGGARQQHRDDGGAREAVVRGAPLCATHRAMLLCMRALALTGTPYDSAPPMPAHAPLQHVHPLTTLHPSLTRCPSRPTSAGDDHRMALPHSLFRLLTLGRSLRHVC